MTLEPGLDLHEWETRWSELEEALADDPAQAIVAACDEIEELLRLSEAEGSPELEAAFASAREVARRVERGDDVDPGDLGGAVENLRTVRDALASTGPA